MGSSNNQWIIETRAKYARAWLQLAGQYRTGMDCYAALCGEPRAHRTRFRNVVTGEIWTVGA